MSDAELLLEWANDAEVRRWSFDSEPIQLGTHRKWLGERLESPDTVLYICETPDGRPIGYARVERRDEGVGEISASVQASYRGRGFGRSLIALASARSRDELGVDVVTARVKPENIASIHAFAAAGFRADPRSADDVVVLRWPAEPVIPHSRPFIGEVEVAAVQAVLRSRGLAQGTVAAELEARWCELTGMRAAACVGSGLGALRLAVLALGVRAGDEVIVPAYSCVALLNATLALGAAPVLADVYRDDWTLSIEDVQRRVTRNTRAVVAVDLFGMPSRLAELGEVGLPIVEDCAHGIGGRTNAGPFGGATDISISSFYATKMVGAGEGGIVAARDPELIERVRDARDYGDRAPSPHNLNDKMTDIEAAIANEQLKRLAELLQRRSERAEEYGRHLARLAERGLVVLPPSKPGRIWYRYAVRLVDRSAPAVCSWMADRGVRVEQPVWDLRACGFWGPGLDVTAEAFDRVVSLPLYPDLGLDEQRIVCETFSACLESA